MRYVFEDFVLDRPQRELRRHGDNCPVEPQVFDLLAHLIDHRDRVVPREELFGTIWQGRVVSDAALSSRIKATRAAIGDDGASQALIRTVHGRGFRFVGVVVETKGSGHTAHSRSTGLRPGERGRENARHHDETRSLTRARLSAL